MNKLILLCTAALFLSVTSAYSQLNTANSVSIETSNYHYDSLIKTSDGSLFRSQVRYGLKKMKYRISKLDGDLSISKSHEFETSSTKKLAIWVSYTHFSDGLYAIKTILTRSKYSCTIQKVDQSTLMEVGEVKVLFDIDHDSEYRRVMLQYWVSENGKYLVVKNPKGEYSFFDSNLSSVIKTPAGGSKDGMRISTYLLSNTGDFYQVYSDIKNKKSNGKTIKRHVVSRTNSKGEVQTHDLMHEKILFEPKVNIEGSGNIVLVGFMGIIASSTSWSSLKPHGSEIAIKQGYYYIKLDNEFNEVTRVIKSFGNDMILQGLKPSVVKRAEKKIAKGQVLGYEFMYLNQLIPTEDGFYAIGEEYINETVIDPVTKDRTYVKYHGTILVLKLNNDGELISNNKMLKAQSNHVYGGYCTMYSKGSLYILFNDLKQNEDSDKVTDIEPSGNEQSMNIYVVEVENGMLNKNVIVGDTWEKNILLPGSCQTIGDELYIYTKKYEKGLFGKLTESE